MESPQTHWATYTVKKNPQKPNQPTKQKQKKPTKKSDIFDFKHYHNSWQIKDKISRSCFISLIISICPVQIPLKPVCRLYSACTPRLINKLELSSSFIKALVLWETLVMGEFSEILNAMLLSLIGTVEVLEATCKIFLAFFCKKLDLIKRQVFLNRGIAKIIFLCPSFECFMIWTLICTSCLHMKVLSIF